MTIFSFFKQHRTCDWLYLGAVYNFGEVKMDFDLYDDLLVGEAEPTEKEKLLTEENEVLKVRFVSLN